jgi:phage tail protein X
MAAQFIEHVTSEGERWDSLAWRYYGDATLYAPMMAANPAVPFFPVFPSGVTLAIPLIQVAETPATDLPPWGTL